MSLAVGAAQTVTDASVGADCESPVVIGLAAAASPGGPAALMTYSDFGPPTAALMAKVLTVSGTTISAGAGVLIDPNARNSGVDNPGTLSKVTDTKYLACYVGTGPGARSTYERCAAIINVNAGVISAGPVATIDPAYLDDPAIGGGNGFANFYFMRDIAVLSPTRALFIWSGFDSRIDLSFEVGGIYVLAIDPITDVITVLPRTSANQYAPGESRNPLESCIAAVDSTRAVIVYWSNDGPLKGRVITLDASDTLTVGAAAVYTEGIGVDEAVEPQDLVMVSPTVALVAFVQAGDTGPTGTPPFSPPADQFVPQAMSVTVSGTSCVFGAPKTVRGPVNQYSMLNGYTGGQLAGGFAGKTAYFWQPIHSAVPFTAPYDFPVHQLVNIAADGTPSDEDTPVGDLVFDHGAFTPESNSALPRPGGATSGILVWAQNTRALDGSWVNEVCRAAVYTFTSLLTATTGPARLHKVGVGR